MKKNIIFIIDIKNNCQKPFLTRLTTSSLLSGSTWANILSICTYIKTIYINSVHHKTIQEIISSNFFSLILFVIDCFIFHEILTEINMRLSNIKNRTFKKDSMLINHRVFVIMDAKLLSAEAKRPIIMTLIIIK